MPFVPAQTSLNIKMLVLRTTCLPVWWNEKAAHFEKQWNVPNVGAIIESDNVLHLQINNLFFNNVCTSKELNSVLSCKYYIPELGKTGRVWPSRYLQVAAKSM